MRWPWVRRSLLRQQADLVTMLREHVGSLTKKLTFIEDQRDKARAAHGNSLERVAFLEKELAKADAKEQMD